MKPAAQPTRTPGMVSKKVLLRDFVLFQLKLLLDGFKDVIVVQLAIAAVLIDLLFGGRHRGRFFYGLMRITERFDLWLNLYGSVRRAGSNDDGLFEVSRSGANTMLGKLEQMLQDAGLETGEPNPGKRSRKS